MRNYRQLAQRDPNRLVRLLETSTLTGEDLRDACRFGVRFLPEEKMRVPLFRNLQRAKTFHDAAVVLNALTTYLDDEMRTQLQDFMPKTAFPNIRKQIQDILDNVLVSDDAVEEDRDDIEQFADG